jgi:ADP-ribose pyrophosphatase
VIRAPAAAVLLYDPDTDLVILIEQFRIGAIKDPNSPWLLEIVAGVVDDEEPYEQCARREASEEAGHSIDILIHIIDYWVSAGTSNEKVSIFCGLVKANPSGTLHGVREEGEDIKIHTLPSKDAFTLVHTGKVANAPAIIALQWLELNRSSLLAGAQDILK